jgi:hypothetical protein
MNPDSTPCRKRKEEAEEGEAEGDMFRVSFV